MPRGGEGGAHHNEELAHFHLLLIWGGDVVAAREPPAFDNSEHDDGVAPAGVGVQMREGHLPAAPSHKALAFVFIPPASDNSDDL